MYIPIKKIIVADRIRKDFGDLNELAKDIEENGLINPPVINKDFVLLAGERRLRACKLLGWEQIPVNMMDTRDAEHELNIEISENDVRKDFSKSERVDYMKRLYRIEQAKAIEREKAGVKDPRQNSDKGRSDETVSKQFDVSRDTMRKEISIVDNKDLLDPSDFAEWDEGKLSTNKAYLKLKEKLSEQERTIQNLESRKPETITVEKRVVPADYEDVKRKAKQADAWKKDYENQQLKTGEKQRKILELQDEIKRLQEQTVREQSGNDRIASAIMFASMCSNFIERAGGYVWLSTEIMNLPERERNGYIASAQAVHDWAQVVLDNIERSENGIPAVTERGI